MKIAINGTGVAGPALAWWLKKYGFEPVLFEEFPALRTGGYIIDFWGLGYDIAERMGILPKLHELGYKIESLQVVDESGRKVANMDTSSLSSLVEGRYLSIARSDLSATIYHACKDIETRFGTTIKDFEELDDGVQVHLSDGSKEHYDLVIGADGLHSHIRSLAFGPEEKYEKSLGAYVAAFTLDNYQPRKESTYITCPVPKKMIARASLRGDKTLFLFTFRSELVDKKPNNNDEAKEALRSAFSDMQWEAPSILSRLDEADDFYFDHVSQIHMGHWSKGRVALLGDAAACVSLLAGEGTGLAITEAYVLAGELYRANGDYKTAFQKYEQQLIPFLRKKQKAALGMLPFFASKNRWQVFLSKLVINSSSIPFLSKYLLDGFLHDNFNLPDYTQSVER